MALGKVRAQALAAATFSIALAATLRAFPPSEFHFYPPCLFQQWTGLACPGCGITRAAAALLAGRLADAAHANLLAVLLAPAALAFALWQFAAALRSNRWRPLPHAPRTALALAALALAFGIARNLPR